MTDSLHITPEGDDDAAKAAEEAAIKAVDDKEASLKAGEEQGEEPKAERPEWLPEKFQSPEDLAKAYDELQRKLGASDQKADTGEKSGEKPEGESDDESGVGQFDWNAFAEAAGTGEISDEMKAAAKEAGIPESVLEGYASGIQAQVQLVRQQMFDSVGGEEEFTQVSQWAQANADNETLQAYNDALDAGDVAKSIDIMKGLKEQYVEANGQEGIREKGTPSGTSSAYESWAQVKADMAKPEYSKDPAFRAQVEQKLKQSKL